MSDLLGQCSPNFERFFRHITQGDHGIIRHNRWTMRSKFFLHKLRFLLVVAEFYFVRIIPIWHVGSLSSELYSWDAENKLKRLKILRETISDFSLEMESRQKDFGNKSLDRWSIARLPRSSGCNYHWNLFETNFYLNQRSVGQDHRWNCEWK